MMMGFDESDPLWQLVLVLTKVCDGDRDLAEKLLSNPDALLNYPEVVALIAAGEGATDELADKVEDMKIEETASPAAATVSAPSKKDTAMEVAAVEGDPVKHFNLVFIGHVDAGKSTLSGNILYLTKNVDKRTNEKNNGRSGQFTRLLLCDFKIIAGPTTKSLCAHSGFYRLV